ncbi:hypothetical protein D3C86_1965470 [compost metagenome]
MHQRTPVRDGRRRRKILTRAFTQFIQRGKHQFIGVFVFALSVIDHVQTVEQLIELLIDFAKGQCAFDAEFFRRGVLP